jgi:two-component system, OmpR family, sensor histidine kinase BaeS
MNRSTMRTRRRPAAARLLEHDELVALLAHDIRSPLHTLGMSCELVAQRIGSEDTLTARHLDVMRQTLMQMDRLVGDVLALATTQQIVARTRACRVDDVLREAVTEQKALAELHHVELVIDGSSPECWIGVERAGLLRILANLLTNAIRFTPPTGRVQLQASFTADAVCIAVQDSGPGIAPERLSALLSDPSPEVQTSQRQPLGLLLVKRLVAAFGGQMQLETGAGRGSRFTVCFRRATPPADPQIMELTHL